MTLDHESLYEHVESLEFLLEDMPLKAREELSKIIKDLKNSPDIQKLIKIQDDLETVSGMNNVDSFTRNEIMNIITLLENQINN